ncbi:peptide chain release factor 2 [bacterium]|nr:peptide chain release factor 2 [bacterium]
MDLDPRAVIADLSSRLTEAREFLDIDGKITELEKLRILASDPTLWEDPDRARNVTRTLASHEGIVAHVERLQTSIDDAGLLLEMAADEGDESAVAEVVAEVGRVDKDLADLERESLFFGEYDDRPAILSVHAGAGGVDAADWADILLRMYLRYLEQKGFSVEIDEYLGAEEAGIRSATITVRGEHAYGYLEGERGTHRLVRISPFDSANRRHTAFAGVDVIPEVEVEDVEIDLDDLRVDTYRASGSGGQHINKTDSAVRLTHLPTGIVVACQAERSQLQNRQRAMALLAARLAVQARHDARAEIDEIRGEQTEAGWGRQIRSYVMQPYQMVKDLRTDVEVGNIMGVLDGDLDKFVDGYLSYRRSQAG